MLGLTARRTVGRAIAAHRLVSLLALIGVLGALTGCWDLSISDHRPPTTSHLASISVSPPDSSLAAGLAQRLTATGIYSDGSKQDLSSSVTWTSSQTAIARIDAGGTATAIASGSTTITATDGGIAGSTTLTVTSAHLMSIGVTPAAPSIALGTAQDFKATGVYSDNSVHDLTNSVSWRSVTPAIASISSAGLATALRVGTTIITGTLGAVTSSSVTLRVTGATVASVIVMPATATIANGTQQLFTATGVFSDRSTQDLSNSATWSSSAPTIATIGNTSGSNGLATAAGVGTASITATFHAVTSPAAMLTVSAATLVSIAVTPAVPSLPLGLDEQLMATGTFTDNSTQDLTSAVTWTSSNTSVADVSSALNTAGFVTSHSVGSTNITATLGAISSAPVALTVTAATLVSIAVTPVVATIALGAGQQFTATGLYTDSSTQSLTTSATWFSSSDPVASISNASGSNGLATSLTAGSTTITAVLGSVTSNPVTLTVTESVLYSFSGAPGDGANPWFGSLLLASDGNFYGLTAFGGINSDGTVFKITPAGVETVLWSFGNGNDGSNPYGNLMQGSDGNFYGMTNVGGLYNWGTVFKITPAGVETVLWSFANGNDGANPYGSLIQGSDGNFYGMTYAGGTYQGYVGGVYYAGTVFKITPAGVETVLWSFGNGGDGSIPYGNLVLGGDGNFYGMTYAGGGDGMGTIFKITPAGAETLLWSFGAGGDGADPVGSLTLGSDGNFYGLTPVGGANGAGTVFKITPGGAETVFYSFDYAAGDGYYPAGGLIQETDGNFYGTTGYGGSTNGGTIFDITPSGTETVLYSFGSASAGFDGLMPHGDLTLGSDGAFYGMTTYGGANDLGTVFTYK